MRVVSRPPLFFARIPEKCPGKSIPFNIPRRVGNTSERQGFSWFAERFYPLFGVAEFHPRSVDAFKRIPLPGRRGSRASHDVNQRLEEP
jgi:hypothetical protein